MTEKLSFWTFVRWKTSIFAVEFSLTIGFGFYWLAIWGGFVFNRDVFPPLLTKVGRCRETTPTFFCTNGILDNDFFLITHKKRLHISEKSSTFAPVFALYGAEINEYCSHYSSNCWVIMHHRIFVFFAACLCVLSPVCAQWRVGATVGVDLNRYDQDNGYAYDRIISPAWGGTGGVSA